MIYRLKYFSFCAIIYLLFTIIMKNIVLHSRPKVAFRLVLIFLTSVKKAPL